MPAMSCPSQLLAFMDVGGGEMFLIFLVMLLLFGGKRLPELARGLGKSMREFKKATSSVEEQIKQAMDEPIETLMKPPRKTLPPASSQISHTPPAPLTPPPASPPPDSLP